MKKRRNGFLLLALLTVSTLLLLFFGGGASEHVRVMSPPGTKDPYSDRGEQIETASGGQSPLSSNSPVKSKPPVFLDTSNGSVELIYDNGFYICRVPFENIMGLNGYKESRFFGNPLNELAWQRTTYYAVIPDLKEPLIIAESFSFDIEGDSARDVDGDGVTDLICNCQFGGDGAERVYIFRKRDGVIEVGQFQLNELLPKNAIIDHGTVVTCDPDTMITTVKYTLEDTFERIVERHNYSEGCYLYEKYER